MFTLRYYDNDIDSLVTCSFLTEDEMYEFASTLMIDGWISFEYPSE